MRFRRRRQHENGLPVVATGQERATSRRNDVYVSDGWNNLARYGVRALTILTRAVRDRLPFAFFGAIGAVLALMGGAAEMTVFTNFLLTGKTSPYQSLTILGAIGFTADLWMSQVGAKAGGASPWSLLTGLLLGAVGAIVGLAFLGIGAIPGAIVGAIAGVILAEYYKRQDWREAFKAGGGWLVGCTLSGGVQFLIAILMILIFVWQALRG